jgi:hypothetical protein
MGGLVGGVVGSVGGLISGGSAQTANQNSATAINDATQKAYGGAKFNPIGITTNFGSSNYTMGPNGQLTSAGYTLNPQLQGIQTGLMNNATAYNPAQAGNAAQPLYQGANSLFNLGQSYLAQDPNQVAQNWLTQQQNLLAPGREQETANVNNQQFQTGRTGLAVGGTSSGYNGVGSPGLLSTNPQLQAMYNARAQQDATLAGQAQQQGQNQQLFGSNLMTQGGNMIGQVSNLTNAGYSPLNTILGIANTTETMGSQPFNMSNALAGQQSQANATAGQMLMSGTQAVQPYLNAAQAYSPMGSFVSGIGNSIANWQGGGTTNPYANNSSNTMGYGLSNNGQTPGWSNPYAGYSSGATSGSSGLE